MRFRKGVRSTPSSRDACSGVFPPTILASSPMVALWPLGSVHVAPLLARKSNAACGDPIDFSWPIAWASELPSRGPNMLLGISGRRLLLRCLLDRLDPREQHVEVLAGDV